MEPFIIRPAAIEDAAAIQKIYKYYVLHTAISWEWEVPTAEEFEKRITKTLQKYPYFVAEQKGEILGYAYAGAFVGRAAYDWSAELTIYLKPEIKKQGIGRALYEALESKLKELGYRNLYACIGYLDTEDEYLNKNSAQFHEHLGYRLAGRFEKCGQKFGRWYDMIWMEKIIGEHKQNLQQPAGFKCEN